MKSIVAALAATAIVATTTGCGSSDDGSSDDSAAVTNEASAEKTTSTEEAPPPPDPIGLTFRGPDTTQSDTVTLRGRVDVRGAKVRVAGKRADVSGKRWKMVVSIRKRGDNSYKVIATKSGLVKESTMAVVTRKLSAAEKAVIRQERAERRANGRALESAESYLAMSGFSKQGLYQQLSSSAGEGFTPAQAQYAVDHVDVDWNKEAVESARSYLEMSPMSRTELIQQLSSSAGEGFTYEQAVYAVNKVY